MKQRRDRAVVEPTNLSQETETLVELLSEEAVLGALVQSGHAVEWIEANEAEESDES
jgi:hypothetical protein